MVDMCSMCTVQAKHTHTQITAVTACCIQQQTNKTKHQNLVGFVVVQMGISPYLTSTLVSVILWSGVTVTAAATLSCY